MVNVRAAACAVLLTMTAPSPSLAQSAPHVLHDSDQADAERWFAVHRSYVDRANTGDVRLLFLGDSLTYGWLVDGLATWKSAFVPLGAQDFGIGGDRTDDVLWRIHHGELDRIAPRLVVLSIGTNDLGIRRSVDETVAGIVACVRAIRAKLPKTSTLVIGIFPRGTGGPSTPIRRSVTGVNARVAKLDDGRHVRYLDSGVVFLAPDGSLKPALFRPDRRHLSSAGYRAWSESLRPKIDALLR